VICNCIQTVPGSHRWR